MLGGGGLGTAEEGGGGEVRTGGWVIRVLDGSAEEKNGWASKRWGRDQVSWLCAGGMLLI